MKVVKGPTPIRGKSRKLARLNGMSVLPSTADVVGPPRHVRFVPSSGHTLPLSKHRGGPLPNTGAAYGIPQRRAILENRHHRRFQTCRVKLMDRAGYGQ